MAKLSLNELYNVYCEHDFGLSEPISEERKDWIRLALFCVLQTIASRGLVRMVDFDCGSEKEFEDFRDVFG